MPFLRLTLGTALDAPRKQHIAGRITQLIVDLLGKRHAVTAVLVEAADASGWSIGGELAELRGMVPVHAEICITAGTNSAAEKAGFISALHALLGEEIGALPEASYLVIRELPAGDWGYAGQTQAARRLAGPVL